MLNQILNLFPTKILQNIGTSIVENLYQRDELKNWNSVHETLDDLGEIYCYLGLEIKIVPCVRLNYWYWDWFVYDGRGIELIQNGCATTENDAIASAMKWINAFLASDEDENE